MRNRCMLSAFVMAICIAVAIPAMAGFADQAQAPPDGVYLYNSQNDNDGNIYISGDLGKAKAPGMWDTMTLATSGEDTVNVNDNLQLGTDKDGAGNDVNDNGNSDNQAVRAWNMYAMATGESGDGVAHHYGGDNFTTFGDKAMTMAAAIQNGATNGVGTVRLNL